MQKFLILQTGNAEDLLMTTPLLRCIKKQYPASSIHLLTHKLYERYIFRNPNVDHLHFFSENNKTLIADFNLQQFDAVLDLSKNAFSAEITSGLHYDLPVSKTGIIEKLRRLFSKPHSGSEKFFKEAEWLKIENDRQGIGYFLSPENTISGNDLPTSHQAGFVSIIMPATRQQYDAFPVEKIKQLCAAIDHPVILLGDWEDSVAASDVRVLDDIKIYNACGKFSFDETTHLIQMSKAVVSQENALMYIACALRKKLVALWPGSRQVIDLQLCYDELFIRGQKQLPYINNYAALKSGKMDEVARQLMSLL